MVRVLGPGDRLAAVLYRRRDRRREREDFRRFAALIASPHAFDEVDREATTTTNFALPANGRLAISADGSLSLGDLIVHVGPTRQFEHPDLSADELWPGSWGERGRIVSVEAGPVAPAVTYTLHVRDGFGRWYPIATGGSSGT